MSWIQFKANISPELAEIMEEALLGAGASAVTLEDTKDQPILEPERGTTPLWDHTTITGLFSADEDLALIKKITKNVFQNQTDKPFPSYRIEILENQDWTRKWMEHFEPIQIGSLLWICPSWRNIPNENAVNLMLDPGLAFGTGTHPTTSLCLKWLDQCAANNAGLENKTIIDYGCGSGILAIAALLLGADSANCVDNDPQALLATHDNAERNNINPAAIASFLPKDTPEEAADIVLANILAQPLYDLRERLAKLTKPEGYIILSGILENQAEALNEYYAELFDMQTINYQDGWARLTGIKKA